MGNLLSGSSKGGAQHVYMSNVARREHGAALVLIDPQADFHAGGTLAIAGADADAERTAAFISRHAAQLREVYVTLDTHQLYHIAHPCFWLGPDGACPKPFEVIGSDDVRAGKWRPAAKDRETAEWAEKYVAALERNGRFVLCIWPPHCLVGTPGHAVVPAIAAALQEWERTQLRAVTYVLKGANSWTEHYSGIKAEVARPDDPRTALNTELLDQLKQHDQLILCGQAKSHCVNFTVRDIAEHWDKDASKLVVLEDCCSSVPGFTKEGDRFVADMRSKGLSVVTNSASFMPMSL
jgi:nicotinamidase/pyrazinamidase